MHATLTLFFVTCMLFANDVLGIKETPYHASTEADMNKLEGRHVHPKDQRVPGHKRRPGFYDPHNHFTGIISWNGIGLATEGGKAAMEKEMEKKEARKALDDFKKAKCGKTTQGDTMEGSRAPFKNEDQMYVYQFLHSGKICGIEICADPADQSLCSHMQTISHEVNKVLAGYLTTEKIFSSRTMTSGVLEQSNIYGTMTLHPLLHCAKRIFGQLTAHEENEEKLANTLMSAMSASPMIDFDTSYGSRGYVMKSQGNYCWINDFTLQTLIDDDVSYVEVANSIKKVSETMQTDQDKRTDCIDCCKSSDREACKSCEYTMLNKELKITMFGHEHVKKKQEFVHVKWNMMHLTSTFASTPECKTGDGGKPARIVQTVKGECVRKGEFDRLQCVSGLKNGCGECDNEQENMGYFDGMFMPATGMGDIEAKCPAFHDVDQVITCTSGAKVGGPNCWPLQNDDIAGMDYASPESSCFQDAAVAERMDQHLRLVYLASKEVNKHKSGLDIVPKVYHVHCGEGFPIYDKEKYFKNYPTGQTADWTTEWSDTYNDKSYGQHSNEYNMKEGVLDGLCETAGLNYDEQKHFDVVYCGHFSLSGDMMPCHVITARHNMITLATGIKNYIKKKPLEHFEQLVTVRFGHSTWATYNIAISMRDAGIHSDCNLGSNLATQAYTWPVKKDNDAEHPGEDHERPNFLFTEDPGDQKTSVHTTMYHELNDPDNDERKLLVRGFANHGFLRLFIAGVKVELGSDGAGVEHSLQMVDYKVAKVLIHHLVHYHDHSWKKPAGNADEWEWKLLNKWDADESDKKLSKDKWNIDTLFGYSKSIHETMNPPAPAPLDFRFKSTSKTGLRSNTK